MCNYIVKKSPPLSGTVELSTSKNSMLPILAACLLTSEEVTLHKVPNLTDVRIMLDLLISVGAKITNSGDETRID